MINDIQNKSAKRTPAQRMFYRQYLPYIKQKTLELFPQSYMTIDTLTDEWLKSAKWDTKFAQEIVFQSKTFFKQTIHPNSGYAWNPDFLSQVIDLIIQYLKPYFLNAPHYHNAEKQVQQYLENKLKTENAFYNRAIARYENSLIKKARRTQTETVEKSTSVTQNKKRERIKVERTLDKFNNTKYAIKVDIQKIK